MKTTPKQREVAETWVKANLVCNLSMNCVEAYAQGLAHGELGRDCKEPKPEKTLAERAVACKHWRWMPGMLMDGTSLRIREDTNETVHVDHLPDFDDAATALLLIALVREVLSDPYLHVCCSPHRLWYVEGDARMEHLLEQTEVEALVVALEGAK